MFQYQQVRLIGVFLYAGCGAFMFQYQQVRLIENAREVARRKVTKFQYQQVRLIDGLPKPVLPVKRKFQYQQVRLIVDVRQYAYLNRGKVSIPTGAIDCAFALFDI